MLRHEVISDNPEQNLMAFLVTCEQCGTDYIVEVEHEGYLAWSTGQKLLQYALPTATHSERELLLSGTCGPCYDSLFQFTTEDEGDNEPYPN